MAVTIDIGEPYDIHPKNKQEVGKRLALNALALTYKRNAPYSGPLFESAIRRKDTVVLTFRHTYDGLKIDGYGKKLVGFELAGKNGIFHPASGTTKKETVFLKCKEVKQPIFVRYAWDKYPECNLYNSAGLPASPFTGKLG